MSVSLVSRWLVLPVVLMMLASSGCAGKQEQPLLETIQSRGKLTAGVKYDSKPFGYLDMDGELKGYDIDVMREVAKRVLGDENAVEFQQVLSSTRIIAINSRALDVVAATMTITPEREKIIDFSQPYYMAHQGVIVPATSSAKGLQDLGDKTIFYVFGTTGEVNIKKALPNAKFVGFKTTTDALSALKSGRGDAFTTDDTLLYGFMQQEPCGFRMLPEKLSDEPYGLGFRQDERQQSTHSLQQRVNEALADMRQDGTLERLRQKWVEPSLQTANCQKKS